MVRALQPVNAPPDPILPGMVPLQRERSDFCTCLCQQGEKWSQCWPRPFCSQPSSCHVHSMSWICTSPYHTYFASAKPLFNRGCAIMLLCCSNSYSVLRGQTVVFQWGSSSCAHIHFEVEGVCMLHMLKQVCRIASPCIISYALKVVAHAWKKYGEIWWQWHQTHTMRERLTLHSAWSFDWAVEEIGLATVFRLNQC